MCLSIRLGMLGSAHSEFSPISLKKCYPEFTNEDRISMRDDTLRLSVSLANHLCEKFNSFVCEKMGN